MFKLTNPPQRVIEYSITCEYIDLDGNLWSYMAYVQMTYKYEVRDVIITALEVEDINGEPILFRSVMKDGFMQTLRDHASDMALEKVSKDDFESEADND